MLYIIYIIYIYTSVCYIIYISISIYASVCYIYVYTPIYLYSIYILDTFTRPTQDLGGDVKDVSDFYPDPWGIGSQ